MRIDLFFRKERRENIRLDKVKHCIQTCDCCPSQWDIYTWEGEYIYARYRFGRLTLTRDLFRDSEQPFFTLMIGNELDGEMSTERMKELTKDVLIW